MSNPPEDQPKGMADSFVAIFVNREKELRSGWRVALFYLAFVLALIFTRGVADTLARLIPSLRWLAADSLAGPEADRLRLLAMLIAAIETLAAALIASFVCARWLERRSVRSVGFKLHRGWWKDFLLGSLIGGAALALAVGLEAAAGAVHFTVQTTGKELVFGFGYLLIFFVIAAAVEELMFRGFALQALLHNLGAVPAVAITAVLFGLAHINNDNVSAFAVFNTILAGVWLGTAYVRTRSLWLPTALHYAWNFVMVFVFGLNVSGIPAFERLAWLHGESKPPRWISGADYGPEGGVVATLALVLSTLLIWKSGWFRATAEMLAGLAHGERERPLSILAGDEPPRD
ncbi:MAG TPA: type II CAAX endopeptidase family protein [Blastocatellia bacterium]|nr:type II CAAX endopeptidase family protein [Blastocatellia bacterium]